MKSYRFEIAVTTNVIPGEEITGAILAVRDRYLLEMCSRYYDAECPEGVDTPFALPFALRYLGVSAEVGAV